MCTNKKTHYHPSQPQGRTRRRAYLTGLTSPHELPASYKLWVGQMYMSKLFTAKPNTGNIRGLSFGGGHAYGRSSVQTVVIPKAKEVKA